MPGNTTKASLSHHQSFDIERSIDDVVSQADSASKCYDDDGRLKRTGISFIQASFSFT